MTHYRKGQAFEFAINLRSGIEFGEDSITSLLRLGGLECGKKLNEILNAKFKLDIVH